MFLNSLNCLPNPGPKPNDQLEKSGLCYGVGLSYGSIQSAIWPVRIGAGLTPSSTGFLTANGQAIELYLANADNVRAPFLGGKIVLGVTVAAVISGTTLISDESAFSNSNEVYTVVTMPATTVDVDVSAVTSATGLAGIQLTSIVPPTNPLSRAIVTKLVDVASAKCSGIGTNSDVLVRVRRLDPLNAYNLGGQQDTVQGDVVLLGINVPAGEGGSGGSSTITLTTPSYLTVTGSPLTGTGTLAISAGTTDYSGMISTINSISTTANLVGGQLNVCTATSANYTVTLPAPSLGLLVGIAIAPSSTHLVTVSQHVSESIDGVSSRVMWAGEVAELLCADGTNWTKIGGKSLPMTCAMTITTTQTSIPNAGAGATLVKMDTIVGSSDNTGLMGNIASGYVNILRNSNYEVYASSVSAATGSSGFWQTSVFMGAATQAIGGNIFYTTVGSNAATSCSLSLSGTAGSYFATGAYQSGLNSGGALSTSGAGTGNNNLKVVEIPSW